MQFERLFAGSVIDLLAKFVHPTAQFLKGSTHIHRKLAIAIFVGCSLTVLVPRAQAAFMLATNLIENGDAESGAGSPGGAVVPVPDWVVTGDFTAVNYDGSENGLAFPTVASPGPADRGESFFAGGPTTSNTSATQIVDISTGASVVDTGNVAFNLSGYLGGWESQDDNAIVTASFLDAPAGNVLGSTTIGPVLAVDRSDVTGLLFRSASGVVPIGTRNVEITMDMSFTQGQYNNGYADDLALTFAPVPEPSSVVILAVGLIGVLLAGAARCVFRSGRAAGS